MYRVVICHKCGWARAVEGRCATTTCAHCGKKLSLRDIKPVAVLEDANLAAKYVSALNAKMHGGIVKPTGPPSTSKLLSMLLDYLSSERTRDDIIDHLSRYAPPLKIERILEELLLSGEVIETKPNTFKHSSA